MTYLRKLVLADVDQLLIGRSDRQVATQHIATLQLIEQLVSLIRTYTCLLAQALSPQSPTYRTGG